jgi:hypothetical protein
MITIWFALRKPRPTKVRTPLSLDKTQGDSDWFREAVYELDVALGTRDDNPRLPLHLLNSELGGWRSRLVRCHPTSWARMSVSIARHATTCARMAGSWNGGKQTPSPAPALFPEQV